MRYGKVFLTFAAKIKESMPARQTSKNEQKICKRIW